MITRDLTDQRTILIRQEDHADLSAQFASHWGNDRFSRLAPYETVVSAAAYHDTHFREIEAEVPIDLEQGRPYGHRNTPFSQKHLDALWQNIDWLSLRDPYAGLLVSMHHTGLPQNRYGVINSWQNGYGKAPPNRPMRPELVATVRKLEERQRGTMADLAAHASRTEDEIRRHYRLLQVFDLLSLYLCCDGHADHGMKETTLAPVPVSYGSDQEVSLHIVPTSDMSLRLDPYPFDCSPLRVCVVGRVMQRLVGHSPAECRAGFLRAPRESLAWTLTH